MIIREASALDIVDIAHVAKVSYVDAFGEYFLDQKNLEAELLESRSKEYFEQAVVTDTILVAVDNKNIVGYLQFGEVNYDFDTFNATDTQLRRLYILPENQRQGIGRELINAMLAHEKLEKTRMIYVEVWTNNDSAMSLYEGFGFEQINHRIPFYENGEIVGYDVVMVKKQLEL